MVLPSMTLLSKCRTEMFGKNPTTVFDDRRHSNDFARDIAHLKTAQVSLSYHTSKG